MGPGGAAAAPHSDDSAIKLGSSAQQELKRNLTRNEPLAFIRDFQGKNGLGPWSNCAPAMPVVDLSGTPRPDVYLGLLRTLRERLLGRLKDLSDVNLKDLLAQSFPYFQLPEIRPIVIEVLRLQKEIPAAVLVALGSNPELMESCAIEVKRQVWQQRPKLFAAEVRPRLVAYVDKLRVAASAATVDDLNDFSPRRRRDTPEVKDLLRLIGRSIALYNETLRAVRTHFIETGDPGCCALRVDLLMGLSDAGIASIVKRDPLHQFVEALVICVADREVGEKKAVTLARSLDAVTGAMTGDTGMIILDPSIQHMLSRACYLATRDAAHAGALPSKSQHLQSLTRVYAAVAAGDVRRMMRDQDFAPLAAPVDEKHILGGLYPALAAAVVEDRIFGKTGDPVDRRHAAPPPDVAQALEAVPQMRSLVTHYACERLDAGDVRSAAWALFLVADPDTGKWRYRGGGGEGGEGSGEGGGEGGSVAAADPASVDEQFARALAKRLSTTLRTQLAGECGTALRLMSGFFTPRARRSARAHADAVAIARALRHDVTEANKASIDRVIAELCEHGVDPTGEGGDRELLAGEYAALVGVVPQETPAAAAVAARAERLRGAGAP